MPPVDEDGVTVVVPTRDRPEMLGPCLDALLRSEQQPSAIIVVDSASADPSAVAAATDRSVTVIRCDRPGASRARNVGWRAAQTPLVAFVDDDVRVTPQWVRNIVRPFHRPEVVVVTGAITGSSSGDRTVATTDDVASGRFDLDALGNVGASANVALRREVLRAVGGFDEMLGPGAPIPAAEDVDLFDRALRLGVGWHAADAVADHEQWRSRRELLRLELAYGVGYGARVAKQLRLDRSRAVALVRFEARRLVRDVVKDFRTGYEFGVISRLAWGAGCLRGLMTGLSLRLDDDLYRPRCG